MSKTIILEEIDFKEIKKIIKSGKIIVYPTDIGYCIGCNVSNETNINYIKKIISINEESYISVIAPSKSWVYKNFKIENKNYIKKLPGPFTFALKLKRKNILKNIKRNKGKIMIKIPDHKFYKIIQKVGVPIINIELKNKFNIIDPKFIPKKIKRKSDILIDAGYIRKSPSATIDLSSKIASIIGR